MNDQSGQIKILCVDDERNVLRALERIFLDDDYEIVIAGSGDEGLKIMEEDGPFQVVISDYRMPVMNGVEFLRAVYIRWPETVRIVLSGYADAAAIVAAINEGHVYRFIPKPWNDDELRVTIQNSLERYFLHKRNYELLNELADANLTLEENVQQRTKQLELRNQALEFSQNLVGCLPVGVVGIDGAGMIAYCNEVAEKLLKNVCSDFFGADVFASCYATLGSLVEQTRHNKNISVEIMLDNVPCRVLGNTMTFRGQETTILVLLEADLNG
jgi:two-component system NtrC family sensor kinase